MDVIYNGENRLSIFFFISEKLESKHWGTFKKGSKLEQGERK